MNIEPIHPPRTFPVGYHDLRLAHVATIGLDPDEMVTFTSEPAREYDVVRKDWGYYATPSLAGRLKSFGFRAAVMRNRNTRHCFVVLVDETRIDSWRKYMAAEEQEIVLWLDDFATLSALPAIDPASACAAPPPPAT